MAANIVAIASVNPTTGLLSDYAHVSVPMDVDTTGNLTTVTCFPQQPSTGTTGSFQYPVRLDRLDFLRWYIHFLSHGHRDLAGCQDRLRRVGQQRYADQDRPDRDDTECRARRSASVTSRTAS